MKSQSNLNTLDDILSNDIGMVIGYILNILHSTLLTKGTPQLTCWGQIWCIICEFKIWVSCNFQFTSLGEIPPYVWLPGVYNLRYVIMCVLF